MLSYRKFRFKSLNLCFFVLEKAKVWMDKDWQVPFRIKHGKTILCGDSSGKTRENHLNVCMIFTVPVPKHW